MKGQYAVDARFVEGSAPPAKQLANMLREASVLGLWVMMDLVINHTAFDAPLIQKHPDWFRRDEQGQIVHPGAKDGKRWVAWQDLAEMDNAGGLDAEAPCAFRRRLTPSYAGNTIHLGPSDLLIACEVKPDGQGTGFRAEPAGTVRWLRSARPSG